VSGGDRYNTEKFNGTTWSASGNLSVSKYTMSGAGTQSAALCFSGYVNSLNNSTNVTEKFNGSTWSMSGNMNVIRDGSGGAGTQSTALCFGGGSSSGGTNTTEKFIGPDLHPTEIVT
jgi:hypothetical protein